MNAPAAMSYVNKGMEVVYLLLLQIVCIIHIDRYFEVIFLEKLSTSEYYKIFFVELLTVNNSKVYKNLLSRMENMMEMSK